MAILMELVSVIPSNIDKFYDLLLIEKNGKRALSIPVGEYEGQNIALCVDKVKLSRPLTFDLLCNILSLAKFETKSILINKFIDGTFFANICCMSEDKKVFLDARCSDAICIAMKLEIPILVEEKVLDDAGFEIDNSPNFQSENNDDCWTIEELEVLLKEAIDNGEEDIASIIREKIQELKDL